MKICSDTGCEFEVYPRLQFNESFLQQLDSFETCQCSVTIYKTDLRILDEELFVIKSIRRKDGRILVRFGNALQIQNIAESYRKIPEYRYYEFDKEKLK